MTIESRLAELGIELPDVSPALASYVPVMVHGDTAIVSGQLPFLNGELATGRLGADVDVERGVEIARACGLMILAQLRAAGLLERVSQVVKLGGFVASTPEFIEQHKVVNGASDLMSEVFGEKGRHSRAAVGVPALPLGAAVEVDAIIALTD